MNTSTEGTTSPPVPPRATRRYVRRDQGKWIAGVATGMADAFGIDVTVVRVLWVIVAFASFGVGVAAYVLFWVAFPSERHPAPISRFGHVREWSAGYVAGMVLLGIGLVIVCGELISMGPYHHFGGFAWATLLIGGGAAILLLRNPDGHDVPQPPPPPASSPPPAGEPGPEPAPGSDATAAPPALPPPPPGPVPPAPPTTSAWTQHAPWPAPPSRPPRPPRPRRRPFLTPLTLSALLIGGGLVALLNEAGVTDVRTSEALAGAVVLIGLVLVVSTRYGRARGLIPVGMLLLLATIPTTVIDVPITNGVGERHHDPSTIEQVRDKYELGIGNLTVDLSHVSFDGQEKRVEARLGIGELNVDVPSGVLVRVRAHAGAGEIMLFGRTYDNDWPLDAAFTTPEAGTHGVLDIDARVGAGAINVRRYDSNGVERTLQERYP